jgi:hypothetical protein
MDWNNLLATAVINPKIDIHRLVDILGVKSACISYELHKSINIHLLTEEIRESTMADKFDYMNLYDRNLDIFLNSEISSSGLTVLNSIIDAHGRYTLNYCCICGDISPIRYCQSCLKDLTDGS